MTNTELLAFLRRHKWAVIASASASAAPAAAIVGFAVTDRLELVFDTLETSRKAMNIQANAQVAAVIGGWQDDPTLQLQGLADFPDDAELERLQAAYFKAFPDGPSRLAWPGITYVRVKLTWARFSDFAVDPPLIQEFDLAAS